MLLKKKQDIYLTTAKFSPFELNYILKLVVKEDQTKTQKLRQSIISKIKKLKEKS